MEIKIQSLHFTANKQLEEFVQQKVEKLSHLNSQIILSDVCLKIDKAKKLNDKVCEIKLSLPGNDLFAKSQRTTFEEAINETTDGLLQQLKKRKTKLSPIKKQFNPANS